MKIAHLMVVAQHIGRMEYSEARHALRLAMAGETGTGWVTHMARLEAMLAEADSEKPVTPLYSVIMKKGNSKLPFAAFSVLPVVTCPGAGECAQWCYSLKGLRYPAVFARLAQNTLLMQSESGRQCIRQHMHKMGPKVTTMRLYVDGDFASTREVAWWCETMAQFPGVSFYGYSKSFGQLIAYDMGDGEWPSNYTLNISSGHKHSAYAVERVRALPIARGDFIAVDATTDTMREVYRQQTGRKAFPCPGQCGECRTVKGQNVHACGDKRMTGVDIIIAVH